MKQEGYSEVDVLNIKQIRYFVAVFNDGSLSAAAKEQYVTVQAVSKAIADLERELKSELFVRESRGVHPTPFGKLFYAKAEPVLRNFDELEAFAHNRPSQAVSCLRLALCTPPFNGHEQARASIAAFVSKGLGIATTVALESDVRGLELLRSGQLDALIMVGAGEYPNADCVAIGTVSPGVMMAPSHPLAHLKTVKLSDMLPYPVLVSHDFASFNDAIVATYRSRGLSIGYSTGGNDPVTFFEKDHGLSFAVGIPALGELFPGTIMRLIASEDALAVPICLVSMKSEKPPAYRALERWLASDHMMMGSDPVKRFAAAAAASASHARG